MPADPFQQLLDPVFGSLRRMARPLQSAAAKTFVHAASHAWLSRSVGRLADQKLPRPIMERLLRAYVKAYGVDMNESAEPLEHFETFNDFFTRALRAGVRPMDDRPDVIVSPADVRLHNFGRVPTHGMLEQIKGVRYRLGALLGDEGAASRWRQGVVATLYLAPGEYHRVHAPCDGALTSWRHIPGHRYPVHELGLKHVDGLFAKNERVVFFMDTESFGPMALVMVGAANVSRITLSCTDTAPDWSPNAPTTVTPAEPVPLAKGQELGVFNLGSTVVLLAASDRLAPAGVLAGEHLRLGRPLWQLGA